MGYLRIQSKELVTPPTLVLSDRGTLDWAHYGLTLAADYNHKSGITPLIPDLSLYGGSTRVRNAWTNYEGILSNWINGTPVASSGNTGTGVYFTGGQNRGCTFSIPATNTPRRLIIAGGHFGGQGKMDVSLSDSSASPVSLLVGGSGQGADFRLICIDFEANSASGVTILVNFYNNLNNNGFVFVNSMVLSGCPVQESFRLRNDNGNETGATWIAAQGADANIALNTNFRTRFLLSTIEDLPDQNYQLMYKYSTDSINQYRPVQNTASDFEDIKLVNEVRVPSDPNGAGTKVGPTLTITQATLSALGLSSGMVVSVLVNYRGSSETITNSSAAGQTWIAAAQENDLANDRSREFYCVYNGNWSGDLVFTVTTGTETMSAWLTAWSGVDTTTPRDVAAVSDIYSSPSSPFNVTNSLGITTVTNKACVVRAWTSLDNNQWAHSDKTWAEPAHGVGVRNQGGTDNSMYLVYKVMGAAGTVESVAATQLTNGGDAGTMWAYAWRPATIINPIIISPSTFVTDGEATTAQLTKA